MSSKGCKTVSMDGEIFNFFGWRGQPIGQTWSISTHLNSNLFINVAPFPRARALKAAMKDLLRGEEDNRTIEQVTISPRVALALACEQVISPNDLNHVKILSNGSKASFSNITLDGQKFSLVIDEKQIVDFCIVANDGINTTVHQ